MILFKKLSPSNFQFSKIILESFCLTPLSDNGVWLLKMIDLGSNEIGTNTDSKIWLRSSQDRTVGVEIGSKMGSKPKN